MRPVTQRASQRALPCRSKQRRRERRNASCHCASSARTRGGRRRVAVIGDARGGKRAADAGQADASGGARRRVREGQVQSHVGAEWALSRRCQRRRHRLRGKNRASGVSNLRRRAGRGVCRWAPAAGLRAQRLTEQCPRARLGRGAGWLLRLAVRGPCLGAGADAGGANARGAGRRCCRGRPRRDAQRDQGIDPAKHGG